MRYRLFYDLSNMHIGYDISQTGSGKAGCGFFAHAILQALLELAPNHRYTLYPSFGDFYFDPLMPMTNPYKKTTYGPRHFTREMARQFWSAPQVEQKLGYPDLIQSNNFWCPLQLKNARVIYAFHDMGFVEEPRWTTETNRLGCFDGVFRASLAADWIMATSNASKAHYLRIFPHYPESHIRVIYQCSRFEHDDAQGKIPVCMRSHAGKPFWLNVGTIEPRKNQKKLLAAYARYLAWGGEAFPLVFAGGKGWLMDDFQSEIQRLNLTPHVILTGYVSDEELIWLYRHCYANLYPSLFEGFGLPVLEGMQFGALTITSNVSSMPEVAGDAGLLLDPHDSDAWAQHMLQVVKNSPMREALRAKGRERAKQFSRQHSAQGLLALYDEAIKTPKRYLTTNH